MENGQLISYLENEWSLDIHDTFSIDEITEKFSQRIDDLINHDFNQLIRLLYKVDVSEEKLKYLLKENANEDAGKIISRLIIERQLQKIQSRQNFMPNNTEENDEEKW